MTVGAIEQTKGGLVSQRTWLCRVCNAPVIRLPVQADPWQVIDPRFPDWAHRQRPRTDDHKPVVGMAEPEVQSLIGQRVRVAMDWDEDTLVADGVLQSMTSDGGAQLQLDTGDIVVAWPCLNAEPLP